MKKVTALLYMAILAIAVSSLFQFNPLATFGVLAVAGLFIGSTKGLATMAIAATIVDIRGKAYEPVIEELLFLNKTVADNLVAFETDVKAGTIFTENSNTAVMQAYTSGAPTEGGGEFKIGDKEVTPDKIMFYETFDPNTLRTSRFKRDMKPGAWNTASSEFERIVLAGYGGAISYDCEVKFWQGIKAATKTAIAALTAGTAQNEVGAAEKAWAAAQTATLTEGIVAKLIYNFGALGTRIKVAGTTITSSNIAAEYAKVYAAISPLVLANPVAPYIYAPHSHKQLINIFNISQTYRDLFDVSKDKKTYFYNGIEIKFVPLPENCMIASRPDYLIWCTDSLADINQMKIDFIAANRDDMFVKNVLTQTAHVVNQKYITLYLG